MVAEVAQPLALAVICDLLGVEEPEASSFAAVSDAGMPGRLAIRDSKDPDGAVLILDQNQGRALLYQIKHDPPRG